MDFIDTDNVSLFTEISYNFAIRLAFVTTDMDPTYYNLDIGVGNVLLRDDIVKPR